MDIAMSAGGSGEDMSIRGRITNGFHLLQTDYRRWAVLSEGTSTGSMVGEGKGIISLKDQGYPVQAADIALVCSLMLPCPAVRTRGEDDSEVLGILGADAACEGRE